MQILLTGATGFLGGHLARGLLAAGHRVTAFGRASSAVNRSAALSAIGVRWVVVDPTSNTAIDALFESGRFDAVMHTASIYGRKGECWPDMISANLGLGVTLLQAACRYNVPLFLNSDSSLPRAFNAYSLSKAQLCDWAQLACTQSALHFINVRLEHMFGPDDDESKFTEYVIRACIRNQPTLALTSGDAVRDFIYIDDVVSAYLVLLLKSGSPSQNAASSATIRGMSAGLYVDVPLGSGVGQPVRRFAEVVHRLSGSTTKLQFGALPYRPNEVMRSVADLKEMSLRGWSPRFDLEMGIRRILDNYQ